MVRSISPRFALLFALLSWISCGQRDTAAKNNPASPAQEITFNPLPVDSIKRYEYAIINNSTITNEINGEPFVVKNDVEILSSLEIKRLPPDSHHYLLEMIYRDLKLDLTAGDFNKQLSASRAAQSSDPQERIFAALAGAVIHARIDSNGHVYQVEGLDAIRSNMYKLAAANQPAIEMIQGPLQQLLSPTNFTKNLQEMLYAFSKKRLSHGAVWTTSVAAVPALKLDIPTTYKVKGIDENEAMLSLHGEIQAEQTPIVLNGQLVNLTLKGTQQGGMNIDVHTGMITQSNIQFRAKGTASARMTETPIEIKTDLQVRRLK